MKIDAARLKSLYTKPRSKKLTVALKCRHNSLFVSDGYSRKMSLVPPTYFAFGKHFHDTFSSSMFACQCLSPAKLEPTACLASRSSNSFSVAKRESSCVVDEERFVVRVFPAGLLLVDWFSLRCLYCVATSEGQNPVGACASSSARAPCGFSRRRQNLSDGSDADASRLPMTLSKPPTLSSSSSSSSSSSPHFLLSTTI